MKIFYVADVLVPSRAAASVHIMKMCAAFATYGHEVTLILPDYKNTEIADNVFAFYNVAESFKIKKFPVKKHIGGKYIYSFVLARFLQKQSKGLIYCRDVYSASLFSLLGLPVSIECHREPRYSKGLWKVLLKKLYRSSNLKKVIVISEALKNIFLKSGFVDDKLLVAHDGADIPPKVSPITLDSTKFHAGYVGHLYEGKGMEVIAATAPLAKDIEFHVVGGTDADITSWKSKVNATNITFHGFVPQSKVSSYINAFDVCLLPNQRVIHIWGSSEVNISEITSPLKMFEYMAHKKAIIASDLPVLKEVLNEENSVLCDPDKPEDWANALQTLKQDRSLANRIAENAYSDLVEHYTWEKRAGEIIGKIKTV